MSNIMIFEGFKISNEFPDGVYRIQDLELAERLEYKDPTDIRELITKLDKEGLLPGIQYNRQQREYESKPGVKQVREFKEYWLTEACALFVTSQSRTDKAKEVTKTVMTAYVALRNYVRGQRALEKGRQAVAAKEMGDTALNRLAEAKAHAARLRTAGMFTERQELDFITLAMKQELGYDFTNVPQLTYTASVGEPSDAPSLLVNAEDLEGWYDAGECGLKIKETIDELRRLEAGNRKYHQLEDYSGEFAKWTRFFKINPKELLPNYPITPEILEKSKPYAKLTIGHISHKKDAQGTHTSTKKRAVFNEAGVIYIETMLTERIAAARQAAADAAANPPVAKPKIKTAKEKDAPPAPAAEKKEEPTAAPTTIQN